MRWRAWLGACLLLLCAVSAVPVHAETKRSFKASLQEEATDNVGESSKKEADLVTTLAVDSGFDYTGSRSSLRFGSTTSVRHFANSGKDNELRTNTSLIGRYDLVPELAFLRVTDTLQSIFTDPSQGQTAETDSVSSQVNSNQFTASLVLTPFSSGRTQPRLAYLYVNQLYDGDGLVNKEGHAVLGEVVHSVTPLLDARLGVVAMDQTSDTQGLHRVKGYGGGAWNMTEHVTLDANLGATWTEYERLGQTLDPYWDVKLAWQFGRNSLAVGSNADFIESAASSLGSINVNAYLSYVRQLDRTRLGGQLNLSEYSGEDTISSTLASLSLFASHELTPRLTVDASTRFLTRESTASTRDTLHASLGLSYELPGEARLRALYKYKNNQDSTGEATYDVNTVSMQLMKSF